MLLKRFISINLYSSLILKESGELLDCGSCFTSDQVVISHEHYWEKENKLVACHKVHMKHNSSDLPLVIKWDMLNIVTKKAYTLFHYRKYLCFRYP